MSDPQSKKPGLGPILLTVFLDLLGFGLVIPLLSFYAEESQYGATPLQVTLLMAVYSLAQFLGAPIWGMVSDRIGRRPVLLMSVGAAVLFLAGFASAPSLLWLFIFRTLHGFAAANISTAQAYVADITSGADRAKGMGLIGAAFGVGFSLGPFIGGQLAHFGLSTPIWVAAALSAVNFLWVWTHLPESHPPRAKGQQVQETSTRPRRVMDPRKVWSVLTHPVVGLAIMLVFVATFAFSMMESTFALVAEHVWSMNARDVGNLFGLMGIIGILIQGGMIGRLVKRYGEAPLIGLGYLTNAVGMMMFAVAQGTLAVALAAAVVGVGSSLATPSLNSLISRSTSEDDQGLVLGTSQSLSALARATAPALGGVIFSSWMAVGPMWVGGGMMALALVLSWPATRKVKLV